MPPQKTNKTDFARVVDEGILACVHARARKNKTKVRIGTIEREIASAIYVSQRKLQSWRHKKIPCVDELKDFAEECVRMAPKDLKEEWVIRLFKAGGYYVASEVVKDISGREDPKQFEPTVSPQTQGVTPKALQQSRQTNHFISRQEELTLAQNIQPGQIMAFCGPGGIGKSALVAEAVWKLHKDGILLKRFPDGVIYYNFYNGPDTQLALEYIVTSFNQEPKPSPILAARRILPERQALLILEGVEALSEAAKASDDHRQNYDLQMILDIVHSCGVLITSRQRMVVGAVIEFHDLRPLSPDEAVKLLQAWSSNRVKDDEVARQICSLIGNLPLAIRLVGNYLVAHKTEAKEYLKWLLETPLKTLDRNQVSISELLKESIRQVGEDETRPVLEVIGLLALAPFPSDVVAYALGMSESEVGPILGELVNYSLLQRIEKCHEVSHTLIYTYVHEHYLPSSVMTIRRLAGFYVYILNEVLHQEEVDYKLLDDKRSHVMAVLRKCYECKDWKITQYLAQLIETYLVNRGYWSERNTVNNMGLTAARYLNDRPGEVLFLQRIANTYRDLGYTTQAIEYYEQGLTIIREIGDPVAEGSFLLDLGRVYSFLEQKDKAIQCYEQSLSITRKIGDRKGESANLNNLGLVYYDLRQMEKAIECHQKSLVIVGEIGSRYLQASELGNLGRIYHYWGNVEQATHYIQQALDIYREFGDRPGEITQLGNLGLVYHKLVGDIEKAIDYYKQAIAGASEIGNPHEEITNLSHLGRAYYDLGQIEKAFNYYNQALVIARKIGDRQGKADILFNLGNIYWDCWAREEAINLYHQALTIAQEIANRDFEIDYLDRLTEVYYSLQKPEAVIDYLQRVLSIVSQFGDKKREALYLSNLGYAYSELGSTEKALDYYNQALTISREIGDRKTESGILGNLGGVYESMKQVDQAIEYYQQALVIAREINDLDAKAISLYNLGVTHYSLKQTEVAKQYFEQGLLVMEEIKSPDAEEVRQILLTLGQQSNQPHSHKIGNQKTENKNLGDLRTIYHSPKQVEQAIEYSQQALAIVYEINDQEAKALWLNNLGAAYHLLGQTELAKQYYEQVLLIMKEIESPHIEQVQQILLSLG